MPDYSIRRLITQFVGVVVDTLSPRELRVVGVAHCGTDTNIYPRSGEPQVGRRDVITATLRPGRGRGRGRWRNDPRNIDPRANGWVNCGDQSGGAQLENLRLRGRRVGKRGGQNIPVRVQEVVRIEDNLVGDRLAMKKLCLPAAVVPPHIQLER